eukprot:SAG31_NODE_194_length_20722_cov_19.854192_2_plen_90_part_00
MCRKISEQSAEDQNVREVPRRSLLDADLSARLLGGFVVTAERAVRAVLRVRDPRSARLDPELLLCMVPIVSTRLYDMHGLRMILQHYVS